MTVLLAVSLTISLTNVRQHADKTDMKMFSRIRRSKTLDGQTLFSRAPTGLPLADLDLCWLTWMAELREFLSGPGIDLSDLNFLESLYIEYCTNWHAQPAEGRWNPQTAMNALAVAVGDCIYKQIPGARWQLTSANGLTYLVLTAADGLIVSAPMAEMMVHWVARDLIWINSYPEKVLNRLPQPLDSLQRSGRRHRVTAAVEPDLELVTLKSSMRNTGLQT